MRNHEDDDVLDGYRQLAHAIVTQTVFDYRKLRRSEHRPRPGDRDETLHKSQVERIERFFLSEYGELLCYGKGAVILEKLREEFE